MNPMRSSDASPLGKSPRLVFATSGWDLVPIPGSIADRLARRGFDESEATRRFFEQADEPLGGSSYDLLEGAPPDPRWSTAPADVARRARLQGAVAAVVGLASLLCAIAAGIGLWGASGEAQREAYSAAASSRKCM
jgi:hypothetical protein